MLAPRVTKLNPRENMQITSCLSRVKRQSTLCHSGQFIDLNPTGVTPAFFLKALLKCDGYSNSNSYAISLMVLLPSNNFYFARAIILVECTPMQSCLFAFFIKSPK